MNVNDHIKIGKKIYRILDVFYGRKAKKEARSCARLIKRNYGYQTRSMMGKNKSIHYALFRVK